jgi:hypothetical protein
MRAHRCIHWFALAGTVALLTACNGPGIVPSSVSGHSFAASAQASAVPVLQPNCCARRKILFVTDAFGGSSFTGAVYAFDYDTAKLLGQLPAPPDGWLEVQGACVSSHGNVYFANTALSTVEKYTQGGKYVSTLSDPGQYPVACSFDPSTGDLAVSNLIDTNGGPGSISIYRGGTRQNTYVPPNMSRVYFLGYQDDVGTLWLDGADSSGNFAYDKFAGGTFTPVPITGGSIGPFPGGIQWSSKTHAMNVAGNNNVLYRVSPKGKVIGETTFACEPSNACSLGGFFIKGPDVAVADAADLAASLFQYPAGGKPVKNYVAPYVQPIGIAISP